MPTTLSSASLLDLETSSLIPESDKTIFSFVAHIKFLDGQEKELVFRVVKDDDLLSVYQSSDYLHFSVSPLFEVAIEHIWTSAPYTEKWSVKLKPPSDAEYVFIPHWKRIWTEIGQNGLYEDVTNETTLQINLEKCSILHGPKEVWFRKKQSCLEVSIDCLNWTRSTLVGDDGLVVDAFIKPVRGSEPREEWIVGVYCPHSSCDEVKTEVPSDEHEPRDLSVYIKDAVLMMSHSTEGIKSPLDLFIIRKKHRTIEGATKLTKLEVQIADDVVEHIVLKDDKEDGTGDNGSGKISKRIHGHGKVQGFVLFDSDPPESDSKGSLGVHNIFFKLGTRLKFTVLKLNCDEFGTLSYKFCGIPADGFSTLDGKTSLHAKRYYIVEK